MTLRVNIIIAMCGYIAMIACKKSDDVDVNNETHTDTAIVSNNINFSFDSVGTKTGSSFIVYAKANGKSINERGLVWSKNENPTINDNKSMASTVSGSGWFSSSMSNLSVLTSYHVRLYAINTNGTFYGNDTIIATGGLTTPIFDKKPIFIVGATRASIDIKILVSRGFDILERGVVYSDKHIPTENDNIAKDIKGDIGSFRVSVSGLKARTEYYTRSYFKDKYGYTFGSVDTFKTIIPGSINVIYNKGEAPSADETKFWTAIQKSVDSAKWYFENYTSASKTYWINYSPGTPTADCNNEGWVRVGTNTTYWTIGTMMHEMNHGMGTGTTNWWWGIMQNGIYQGINGQKIVKLTQNDSAMILKGDSQHWWPGGINQNSEVTSSWDYVYNALMMEAMRKDGQPNSGPYVTP